MGVVVVSTFGGSWGYMKYTLTTGKCYGIQDYRQSQRSPPESAGILLLSSHSQSVAEPVCLLPALAGRGGKGFLQPVLPCAFEASYVEAWNLHQESPWCSEAPPPASFVRGSHHRLGALLLPAPEPVWALAWNLVSLPASRLAWFL